MTDNEITSGNLDPYQGLFYKLAKIWKSIIFDWFCYIMIRSLSFQMKLMYARLIYIVLLFKGLSKMYVGRENNS